MLSMLFGFKAFLISLKNDLTQEKNLSENSCVSYSKTLYSISIFSEKEHLFPPVLQKLSTDTYLSVGKNSTLWIQNQRE